MAALPRHQRWLWTTKCVEVRTRCHRAPDQTSDGECAPGAREGRRGLRCSEKACSRGNGEEEAAGFFVSEVEVEAGRTWRFLDPHQVTATFMLLEAWQPLQYGVDSVLDGIHFVNIQQLLADVVEKTLVVGHQAVLRGGGEDGRQRFFFNVMAMIFHKTKLQQKLSKSLSQAACCASMQSEFGTPKKSNRANAWVAMSCLKGLMEREER